MLKQFYRSTRVRFLVPFCVRLFLFCCGGYALLLTAYIRTHAKNATEKKGKTCHPSFDHHCNDDNTQAKQPLAAV